MRPYQSVHSKIYCCLPQPHLGRQGPVGALRADRAYIFARGLPLDGLTKKDGLAPETLSPPTITTAGGSSAACSHHPFRPDDPIVSGRVDQPQLNTSVTQCEPLLLSMFCDLRSVVVTDQWGQCSDQHQ